MRSAWDVWGRRRGALGLMVLLVSIIFFPTLRWLVASWRGGSYYSHGFLVPGISLLLAWRLERRRRPSAMAETRPLWLLVLRAIGLGGSLGLALYAQARHSCLLSAFCLVAVVASTVLALGGIEALKRQAFPLGFALLMIPLPGWESASPHLARWVAALAGAMGRLFGVGVTVTGARIELPGAALMVGTPCSGVNSLAALFTLAVLYAYVVDGKLLARFGLVILSLPLALLANVSRLCLLVLVSLALGVDAALRFFHSWSGLLLFGMAVGMLIAVGNGLGCVGMRRDIWSS